MFPYQEICFKLEIPAGCKSLQSKFLNQNKERFQDKNPGKILLRN